MRASIVQPQDITIEKVFNLSQALKGQDLLAEMLRNELSARRVCSRRVLCSKVAAMIEPLQHTDIEELKEILAELESRGDVTKGPLGQIASSPFRAVSIGKGWYRLYGCIVARQLIQAFSDAELSFGVSRQLASSEDDESVSTKIMDLGGIVLSPERWSGLTKAPYADGEWLVSLGLLLVNQNISISVGGLDNGINDGWQAYRPKEQNKAQNERWQKFGQDDDGRLWRGWHERGWYVFAWTSGKSPSVTPCIKLSSDHTRRTMFALDREVGNFVLSSFSKENDRVFFKIAGFLPVAEYRYLSTIGEYTGKQGNYYCFSMPSDTWPKTGQIINDRLGIKTEQEES